MKAKSIIYILYYKRFVLDSNNFSGQCKMSQNSIVYQVKMKTFLGGFAPEPPQSNSWHGHPLPVFFWGPADPGGPGALHPSLSIYFPSGAREGYFRGSSPFAYHIFSVFWAKFNQFRAIPYAAREGYFRGARGLFLTL